MALRVCDVVVADDCIRIYTSAFKTLGPGGLPCGVLTLTHLPELYGIVKCYLSHVSGELLFPNPGNLKPCQVCQQALRRVCDFQSHVPPLYQTHGVKCGTVSILRRLKMSIEDINLHVGWALYSKSFETYRHFVQVHDIDRDFFHDLLA